jgi:ectoine hydroxylase-related dioxygenase (phytanoyl-CoA dioxygenase family)
MPDFNSTRAEQFREEGYLLLENVIPPGDLQPLIQEFEEVIEAKAQELYAQGLLEDLFEDEPFDRRLARLYESMQDGSPLWRAVQGKHHKTAGMFSIVTHSALLDIVESLIGAEILAHPQFNSRAKLPHHDPTVVPWHQDLGYLEFEADGTFMVNFWIPLVEATMEMGAMQVIPRSHRWGLIPHERIGYYLGIPEEKLPPHEIVDCPVPFGGVLMTQHKTVHRSIPNVSDRVRWSLDLRYCDRHAPTGRASVPGFVCRSKEQPERVARSHYDWLKLME